MKNTAIATLNLPEIEIFMKAQYQASLELQMNGNYLTCPE